MVYEKKNLRVGCKKPGKCGQIGGAAAIPASEVKLATGVEFAMESLDAGIYSLRDSLDALERRLAIVTKPLV